MQELEIKNWTVFWLSLTKINKKYIIFGALTPICNILMESEYHSILRQDFLACRSGHASSWKRMINKTIMYKNAGYHLSFLRLRSEQSPSSKKNSNLVLGTRRRFFTTDSKRSKSSSVILKTRIKAELS